MRLLWRSTPADLGPWLARAVRDDATSAPTGVLADAPPPRGHVRLEAVAQVGTGHAVWARVAGALLRWDLHRAARMVIATDDDVARVGSTIVNAGPFAPVGVLAPCRVVEVVEEAARRGFVYATLPGHPLVGEEQFTVELADDRRAHFRVRSFSRPAGLAAACPAAARLAQRVVNRRYLAAARALAA
jgi:uncharacterized protein (UPF0548 family)